MQPICKGNLIAHINVVRLSWNRSAMNLHEVDSHWIPMMLATNPSPHNAIQNDTLNLLLICKVCGVRVASYKNKHVIWSVLGVV